MQIDIICTEGPKKEIKYAEKFSLKDLCKFILFVEFAAMYNLGLCAFGPLCYYKILCDYAVLHVTLCSCQTCPFNLAVLYDNTLYICNFPATNVYLNRNFYLGEVNKII